jgi:hypothetical protein
MSKSGLGGAGIGTIGGIGGHRRASAGIGTIGGGGVCCVAGSTIGASDASTVSEDVPV